MNLEATRVLIVDDEPALRMTLAANLELVGALTLEAADGFEALGLLGRERVDLVVTDFRMPGMTGVELLRAMRERSITVPLVLMTAFALEDQLDQALTGGVFAVLSKPFDVARAWRLFTRAANRPAVLVVDDTPHVLLTCVESLRAVGLLAEPAADRAEALRLVRTGAVDVCVLDLCLPEPTGAALMQELRAINPSLQVIAVSGHQLPSMVQQMLTSGAQTFLPKPLDPRELVRTVAATRSKTP